MGSKRVFAGQKYTKYNKINNNPENFRGQDCCLGGGAFSPLAPSVAGLSRSKRNVLILGWSVSFRTAPVQNGYWLCCF